MDRPTNTYDIDALYSTVAKHFWTERQRANATGGRNNIRAKGDGPEVAVRDWIASIIGTSYRVTEGHVVTADGRKSKQMDVIVVRDVPAATLYGSRPGEAELVRAESVAAVGEVKSSWYEHQEILRSYNQIVSEVDALQEGLLVANRARFGKLQDDTSMAELVLPVSGREWLNKCYKFTMALALGKCDLRKLAGDLTEIGARPAYASALILDEQCGGAICIPSRVKGNGQTVTGVQCEVYRQADEGTKENSWVTVQEIVDRPEVAAGRLLHLFLSDLQLHLSTWFWEFRDPRRYVKLSRALRRRHPDEGQCQGGS